MQDGSRHTVKLGPEVRNFDQIKAGDTVKARFVESLAVMVAKTGEAPAASDRGTVELAPKGEKPGIIAVDTAEMNATVQKIDYKQRLITLKGPQGNERTFKVDKSATKFKNIKNGDDVYIRFTEAVAITVENQVR
jgi:Cu/Ag efflux protein CusF